jgi:hypothetical protein
MKNQTSEDKKRKIAEYLKRYDKVKIFKFPKRRDINMEQHFYFPREFIMYGRASKAALAVYPVLCSMADFNKNKWFQLSRENIAKMAGISSITVDKGIDDLVDQYFSSDKKLLKRKKVSDGKVRYCMYKVNFIRKDMIASSKDNLFIFHTCIITSGIWAKLSSRAKALYIAMRLAAVFDTELYFLDMDITSGERSEFPDEFRNRKCDYLIKYSISELCRAVNISTSKIQEVIQDLERHKLVEYMSDGLYKVYLKPKIKGKNV